MSRFINVPLKLAILTSARRQQDIARDALMKPNALSQALHGRKDFSVTEQKRLAKVLGRPVEELFLPRVEELKEMLR